MDDVLKHTLRHHVDRLLGEFDSNRHWRKGWEPKFVARLRRARGIGMVANDRWLRFLRRHQRADRPAKAVTAPVVLRRDPRHVPVPLSEAADLGVPVWRIRPGTTVRPSRLSLHRLEPSLGVICSYNRILWRPC